MTGVNCNVVCILVGCWWGGLRHVLVSDAGCVVCWSAVFCFLRGGLGHVGGGVVLEPPWAWSVGVGAPGVSHSGRWWGDLVPAMTSLDQMRVSRARSWMGMRRCTAEVSSSGVLDVAASAM